MLVACRLAGLSALEAHYAGVRALLSPCGNGGGGSAKNRRSCWLRRSVPGRGSQSRVNALGCENLPLRVRNPTVHAASFAAVLAMSSPWCRAPSSSSLLG